ncbi:MAG: MATE family efflux transporter [Eubacteriaceae bacterium]|jgi:putative MATE family efflux protein
MNQLKSGRDPQKKDPQQAPEQVTEDQAEEQAVEEFETAAQAKARERELRMGTEKIPKLLMSMALPAMISMMVQACYNIVDSIFVAQVGENALAAVSLAFPIQMLVIALSVGMGIGINSGISRRLGEKRIEEAVYISEHGFLLALIISVILIPIGIWGVAPYMSIFTSDMDILTKGIAYAQIITCFSFGVIICQAGFATLQGSGNMTQPMIGQILGAVLNIILDPIMIFGLLGCPAMGVAGAAIATVIGQIVGMFYILFIVLRKKGNLLHLNFRKFKYKSYILSDIIKVGLPAAVMQGIGSFMLTGFNLILAGFGSTALAVFGVYFKVQSFVFMPIFGLGQGAMPIFGYNFGARNPGRFRETLKTAIMIAVGIMLAGLLLFQLAPDLIMSMFNPSQNMLDMGRVCLRAISWSFPLAGCSIMISTSFQAMGKSYISMIASILRQLVVLLPAAWVLARLGGLNAVWWSFFIAEVVSLLFLTLVYKHFQKKIFRPWETEGLE